MFIAAGVKYGVNPILLAAVAKQESGFNPKIRSKAGAEGLMQFMPGTAKKYGVNTTDAHSSIYGGAQFLRALLVRYNANVDFALAGYNAGTGAVDKYHGVPPFKETQHYVKVVKAFAGI